MKDVKYVNFKTMEVTGDTKEEALEKVPFFVQGDATQAFKNWRAKLNTPISENDLKGFMVDYLSSKTKNAPGVGFYITVDSAVKNTRKRCYTFANKKNEGGTRKYKQTYQLIDKNTGAVLAECDTTKAAAVKLAKDLYTNQGFRGNLVCRVSKQVVNGEPVAFEMEYTPSKSAHVGVYRVFGIESL